MDKSIIKILSLIEDNGFEAYVVGGYVRDFLLSKDTKDIDICTNARVVDLVEIFKEYNPSSNNYGAVKLTYDDFKFDITTYREDVKYDGDRRNLEVRYIDNKIIKCVGDVNKKLMEDPLRILRAIRFATVLDFKIDKELYDAINDKKELVDELSTQRMKEELTKILVSKKAIKGLDYLKRLKLTTYMGIDYDKVKKVSDICGMYSQIKFTKEYPFTNEEKDNIDKINELVKKGTIDKYSLIEYGLYICSVAGDILGYKKKDIIKMDKELPIKSKKDIAITGHDICEILGCEPSKEIGLVYNELFVQIVEGFIRNEELEIKNYIKNNRKKWVNGGKRSFKEGT